ncbi:MAG: hypothetical protein P1P85_01110 [Patescibacteria group bacterium]|nr:hypothetical protein [Patescibacteria group bacterium]
MDINLNQIDSEKLKSNSDNTDVSIIKERDKTINSLDSSEINTNESENINQTHIFKDDVFSSEKLMGVFDLLSLSYKMFIERWKGFLGLSLILLLVIILSNVIIGFIIVLFAKSVVMMILTAVLISIILYVPSFSIVISIIRLLNDKNANIIDLIKNSTNKIKPFFFASFLGIFVVMGVLAVFLLIPGILFFITSYSGTLFSNGEVSRALLNVIIWVLGFLAIITMLLTMLLIYPVSLVVVIFADFNVVLDDVSPLESFSIGYELIKKKVLSILWRLLVLYCLVILILLVLFFLTGVIASISPFLAIPMFLLLILFYSVLVPVMCLFMYNLYENLRVIKRDKIGRNNLQNNKTKIKVLAIIGFIFILIYFVGFSYFIFSTETLIPDLIGNDNSREYDMTRQYDKFSIQNSLEGYFTKNNKYPESLNQLEEEYRDPETNELYKYRQLNDGSDFEVCIEFEMKEKDCFNSFVHGSQFDKNVNKSESKTSGNENEITIIERDKQRVSDLRNLSSMIIKYKIENGNYPISVSASKLNESNGVVTKIKSANEESNLPLDPKHPIYYYGYTSVDGKSFELSARLENIDDPRCDSKIKRDEKICIYKL